MDKSFTVVNNQRMKWENLHTMEEIHKAVYQGVFHNAGGYFSPCGEIRIEHNGYAINLSSESLDPRIRDAQVERAVARLRVL